jgi:hypothetical protein
MTSKDVLESPAFDRLTTIKTDDLDWEQSRPLKPWLIKSGAHRLHGWWNLDWIKLSSPDIVSVLCGNEQARPPTAAPKGQEKKLGPGITRANRAISELYPAGPPDDAVLPNKQFCGQVRAKLKDLKLPVVSNDTILRAAGRRRN